MTPTPYSKKTQSYWDQIKAMTNKLNKFATENVIPRDEIDNTIKLLEKLKERAV